MGMAGEQIDYPPAVIHPTRNAAAAAPLALTPWEASAPASSGRSAPAST
jgi:hypothetical protein